MPLFCGTGLIDCCVQGGSALCGGLRTKSTLIVSECFFRVKVEDIMLKSCPYCGKIHDKKYILVCGMEAHCCVLQTVIDLAGAGYVPVLVTDCIGSRRESDREMAIRRAEQEGAVLTSSEAILFELLKEAGTPLSKEILKIVK